MNELARVWPSNSSLAHRRRRRARRRALPRIFAANICNPHTRRADARAADEFLGWYADAGGLGNHNFRATGIPAYLKNGGTLKKPRQWRTMPRCAGRSSTIVGAIKSASMKSSGS